MRRRTFLEVVAILNWRQTAFFLHELFFNLVRFKPFTDKIINVHNVTTSELLLSWVWNVSGLLTFWVHVVATVNKPPSFWFPVNLTFLKFILKHILFKYWTKTPPSAKSVARSKAYCICLCAFTMEEKHRIKWLVTYSFTFLKTFIWWFL